MRLSALGDVLHCLPALAEMRARWPEARIDWVCETLGARILDGHPDLYAVHHFPRKELRAQFRHPTRWLSMFGQWRRFVTSLRRVRYDLVVDLQGNLRSQLIARLARGRYRAGFHPSEVKEYAWLFRFRRPARAAGRVHRVEKSLALVDWLAGTPHSATPSPRLPDLSAELKRLTSELGPLDSARPLILLHPFVSNFGRFKEWPAEDFAALAARLKQANSRVLVSWATSERAAAEQICQRSHGAAELAPATPTLRDMAALISLASVVVGADTGPVHLAAALDVPLIALYGPKDPTIYGPVSRRARVLRSDAPCSPCLLRKCEHAICMQTIEVDDVARAVEDQLQLGAEPRRDRGV
ncbi:MAG: lipopolysaccharide heptosyltransferase II [Planctomycetota bacterium]